MDITIGENSYTIRDVDAETGSFLAFRLVNRLRVIMSAEDNSGDTVGQPKETPTPEKKAEAIRGTLSLILMNLDEAEYHLIQRKMLTLIDRNQMVGAVMAAEPIMRNGTVVHKDLKNNVSEVMQLTLEALYYNLSPFFSENGLKLVMTGKA